MVGRWGDLGQEPQGGGGTHLSPHPSSMQDMAQLVAQLASEVVDKDVLFRRSPASPEVASTLWDFLDHCNNFWQNTMAKEATGSPPR